MIEVKQGRVNKEERNVKLLLRVIDKLEAAAGGLPKRGTVQKTHLMLPYNFKPSVYLELHVKMGHLRKRGLQPTKERFSWPTMEDGINHFMPNIHYEAPMKTITSSAPLEITGIDFLNLDSCSGGYQYLQVTTDLFTRFTQVYPTTK